MLRGVLSLLIRAVVGLQEGDFGLTETSEASAAASLPSSSTISATDSAGVNGQRGCEVRRVPVAVQNAPHLVLCPLKRCPGDPGGVYVWGAFCARYVVGSKRLTTQPAD